MRGESNMLYDDTKSFTFMFTNYTSPLVNMVQRQTTVSVNVR